MIDLNIVLTEDGADEFTQFLCGLIEDGYIKYFKLGEGGWNASGLYSEVVSETIIGQLSYSLNSSIRPIIPNSFEIFNGADVVRDDGFGVLIGDGSGTIDYKKGTFDVVFDTDVGGGVSILLNYEYRGELSEEKEQVLGTGSISDPIKNYQGVLLYKTFGVPIAENSINITDNQLPTPQVLIDDGVGNLIGDGNGTINYENGEIRLVFDNVVPDAHDVCVTYRYRGAPKDPDFTLSDLESESDPDLYTFVKEFSDSEKIPYTEMGEGLGKVLYRVFLELFEGIDNGEGDSPYFFEGGLFSANDVMVCYFTFTKIQKTGSDIIRLDITSVV